MSGDLRDRIKRVKERSLNSRLAKSFKTLALAGMTTISGAYSSNAASSPLNSSKDADKVVHIDRNPVDTIPVDSILDSMSSTDGFAQDQIVQELEKSGAFFVDYEKYVKTGNIAGAIVYFTKKEMDERGIRSIGTSPYDISLARENHAVLTGEKEKDAVIKKAAFSNVSNKNFNGGFQFDRFNMENIILWGLVQQDNSEIRDFCKKFVRQGVDIETDRRFIKFRMQWQKKPLSMLNSHTGIRSLALNCLSVTKENFKKFSIENPEMSELLQKEYSKHCYIKNSINYKDFCKAPFLSATAAFSGYIHMPNGRAVPGILRDSALSEQKQVYKIIAQEGGRDAYGRKCMTQAFENIYNKGFPELGCFREWAEMTGRTEELESIRQGVLFAAQDAVTKMPAGENLYATATPGRDGVFQLAFWQQHNQNQ